MRTRTLGASFKDEVGANFLQVGSEIRSRACDERRWPIPEPTDMMNAEQARMTTEVRDYLRVVRCGRESTEAIAPDATRVMVSKVCLDTYPSEVLGLTTMPRPRLWVVDSGSCVGTVGGRHHDQQREDNDEGIGFPVCLGAAIGEVVAPKRLNSSVVDDVLVTRGCPYILSRWRGRFEDGYSFVLKVGHNPVLTSLGRKDSMPFLTSRFAP